MKKGIYVGGVLQLNKETAQTIRVACCTYDGNPISHSFMTDGWMKCPVCRRIYRVIINAEKVTVIEDNRISERLRALINRGAATT